MAYRESYSSDSSCDSRDRPCDSHDRPFWPFDIQKSDDTDSSISQKLTGEIVDEQSISIIGVIVELPEYNLHNETNEHRKFEFTVKASKEAQVVFRARKQGFKTINHDPYLGGSFLSYTMRRKHD